MKRFGSQALATPQYTKNLQTRPSLALAVWNTCKIVCSGPI